jgi:type II secretory pathway pseudopilin PulG
MNFREMSPLARSVGLIVAFIVIIFGIAAAGVVSNYFEKRDQAKAATAEYWRREKLTPEQRLAEDKAKAAAAKAAAQAASAAAAEAQRRAVIENGRRACVAAWVAVLRDPDSAQVEGFEGVPLSATEFQGQIFGRAKNGFGGFVRGSWWCKALRSGDTVQVISITQALP